ncbi:exodeoxyribonuclease V subunit beta [Rhodohalobacter sp. 8-1]|uniref:exodeoxyribonuclease V subunit beta n=1 Tax=Rhodohalobacter sp. 8-1 TaxID=3131972 RepID=UPI0030EB1F00
MKNELTNIFDLEAAPRVLIEASAGTGKTYTIVGIYIRLLIEKNLPVDQILTVTFTKKATAELRERVLERLRACLMVLEIGGLPKDSDDFLSEILSRYKNDVSAIKKLRDAIQNFDDSQVFTIHGFCQKILQEEALVAGTPFDMSVNPSDNLYETAAEDFWRIFIQEHGSDDAGRYLISKLTGMVPTPAELVGSGGVKPLLDKRYARPEGNILEDPKAYLGELVDLKSELVGVWQSEKDDILEILKNCNVKSYQQHLNSRLEKLTDFLNDQHFKSDKPGSLRYFTSDYLYDETNIRKNHDPVPRHRFFDKCSEYSELVADIGRVETTLLHDAFVDIKHRRDELSKSNDSYSYNDLLIKIRDSLSNKNRGDELAAKLKERYPVALVDEFQDTDPIQYDIFSSIYPSQNTDSSLMMIGDPKQAIYAFRGADLHTYFRARHEGVDAEYTLKRNYRSTVQYISAINYLFDGNQRPFIEEDIEFLASVPGRQDHTDPLIISDQPMAPLQVVSRRGVESSKDSSCDFVFAETVIRISDLLRQSENGNARIGDEPVRAGDIAILVSRNKDAYDLQQRLKTVGIDSVTKTDQNIFETLEARKVEMLMNAVLNPADHRILNAALLTGMFGFELTELYSESEDEDKRQALIEELFDLSDIWRREGFYSMFYRLVYSDRRLVHFASVKNSERIITNFFHLADLCTKAEKENLYSPEKLHTWLLRQMENTDEEEKELQLESDQHLVKIMTIHSSKGLQFPIVFCPTLWMGYEPSSFKNTIRKMVEYHTDESDDLIINYDRQKSDQRIDAEFASDVESIAEDVRKTYVALTRAQYTTVVMWDSYTYSHLSGLGASLIGRHEVIECIKNKTKVHEKKGIADTEFMNRFRGLEEASGKRISLEIVDAAADIGGDSIAIDQPERQLTFQPYAGRDSLPVQKRLESFTSLAGHSSEPGAPDYDQLLDNFSAPFEDNIEDVTPGELTIFNFPKGATAGTAIHKLFEHESFEYNQAKVANHSEAVKEVLEEYNFSEKWLPVLKNMLRDVAGADIPGFCLNDLSRKDELREMEFHFPASSADGASLLQVIRNETASEIPETSGKRYMTGFIDLIARQNNKYMILDYKSNYLGDSPDDYMRDNLKPEIKAASYDLQYHLYTVALVKYLRSKIKDFDYDEHFAGVAYLFIRGMKAGSDNGIWFHKPEKNVIMQLEHALSRQS